MININVNVVGVLRENCYFVYNEAGALTVVDPGAQGDRLLAQIRDLNLSPEAILLTHGHFDHIGGAKRIADAYPGTPIYALDKEKWLLDNQDINGSEVFGAIDFDPAAVTYLHDGDTLTLSGLSWLVMSTPGHTAGCACYYIEEEGVLFSGDTLFAGDCGRTDLPTGSTEEIITSIREKLMKLPDETRVFPGHGAMTTIASERVHNMIMRM